MEDFAEVVYFGGSDAFAFADAVNGFAANVMIFDECIGAFATFLHRFPESVVNYHNITHFKNIM